MVEEGALAPVSKPRLRSRRIFRTHTVEEYIVENDTPDVSPLTSATVGHLYLDHLEY